MTRNSREHADSAHLHGMDRRSFLRLTTASALLLGINSRPADAAALKTAAHIVIAGGGLGGIALANRLSRELDGAKITILDRRPEHYYQPGYTLIGTGVWPRSKVVDAVAPLLPAGVNWVQEMVAEFDPVANSVTTDSGSKIRYDFLVVATGLHLDYAAIEGMDTTAIGREGLASVYNGPDGAVASWQAMAAFRDKGGEAIMTLPATPMKCAGAPLKTTFMLRDRLLKAGTLGKSNISFQSAQKNVFGVPRINEEVLTRWQALGIGVEFEHKLVGIDIGAHRARFVTPAGEKLERPYDFIHVVPPMRATDAVKKSALAWQTGPMAGGGWLEVDKETLQHKRFPNVFGVGDINGTPRGKTAATVKKSAPLVAANLIDVIAGRAPQLKFDGYTSCPLIVREGSALLIEFDYEGKLTPSLPMIDPLQESWFAWLMKVQLLKPAYFAVLKGRV
ncbi:NAD(P)/FAD-dependent oxidoreductase [Uliginosibacterium flavum]|uniref:FAD/NAD(P)-binding oxidoreductase n=1 Tax=Uliginosibacterium flavum TaxID=1396831 RepID=A0ABV2THD9_9RHOO